MNKTSHKYCLNCKTELHGKYCHVCGQKATYEKLTIKEFILEYLNIAFVWDTHLIKTLWKLISKPGFLTKEYISGKFIAYMHPLKLNMFLLFVFVTFLLLFNSTEDMGNSIKNLTRDEIIQPVLQISLQMEKAEYAMQVESSPRDTIKLYAPLLVFESLTGIITGIDMENLDSADPNYSAVWIASVPHYLIEDNALILNEDGNYQFNPEYNTEASQTEILEKVWAKVVVLATKYFPLIILLTAPLLAFLIGILHRKSKHSMFKHFIFSLHFTAFLEMVVILLYILHLIASPPSWIMQSIIIFGSCIYLVFAFRKVYETRNWMKAVFKSILTNIGYGIILMLLFSIICIIAIVIIAWQM